MTINASRNERFERITEEIFEPLQRYLRRRAPAHDAEDVFSDVLLTVWRRIEDAPPDSALPWAYGIARRALANQRRGYRRRLRLRARLGAEPVTHHPDPAEVEPDPELSQALDDLPTADREILRLWAWEELEPREIAVVLGITSNAAALRLSRARKRLARALTRQDDAPAGHVGGETPRSTPDG